MSEEILKTSRSLKKEGFSVPMQVPTNCKVMNDTIPKLPVDPEVSVATTDKGFPTDPNFDLRQMFIAFLASNQEECARHRQELSELRSIITSLSTELTGEHSHTALVLQADIIYDKEIRYTQGESFNRHQVNSQGRTTSNQPNNTKFQSAYCEDVDDLDYENPDSSEECDSYHRIDNKHKDSYSLQAIIEPIIFRSPMAATYCCELLAFGQCCKRDATTCTSDHSAVRQKLCIESFNLLSKRETIRHSQFSPWTPKGTPERTRPSPKPPYCGSIISH